MSINSVVVTPASRGSVTLNLSDPLEKPNIDLGYYTSEFDVLAMREALKLSQKFFKAPIWKGYVIEQVSPPANATSDTALNEYIRNFSFTTNHGVGTAAMSAKDASYGVVDPDLRVKGTSGLRIVDASVMVRNLAENDTVLLADPEYL